VSDATLWIVSPMLRDTESLLRLRTDTAEACRAAAIALPIRHLVIDDSAGTDDEVGRLTGLADVEVLTPPFNLGHQRAIVFGLRHLASRLDPDDIVVTMDSDGEDQPIDVPRLVHALVESRRPLALARRTKRSEPWRFRLMYVLFRTMFRVFTGTTVRSGNFAAQTAASLQVTVDHPSFDLCYSSTLLALRRPTVEVPCARGQRFAGESRMNSSALVSHGMRMLLPFSERIAVRMMVVAAFTLVSAIVYSVLLAVGIAGSRPPISALLPLVALVALCLASFIIFVVLFSGFTQASAIAMKGIGGSTPSPADNR
jgi:hypothetical protein